LLNRGAVGEASDLIRRLHAIGDEHVRVFVEDLAAEYALRPADD
jgi:hypothetical protein